MNYRKIPVCVIFDEMSKTKKKSFFAYATITFLTVSFAVWRDCSLLFQTSAMTGIDGYYYVLQINALFDSGHFYFSTNTPLVLYFLSILTFFISDTILAIKIGALILQILLYLGIATLLQILTKNILSSALGIFLTTFSILHLYFLSEFLSNLGLLVCLIWSVFGVVKIIQTKKKFWFVSTGLMVLAGVFTHRSAIGLITLISFFTLCAYVWLNYTTNAKQRVVFCTVILCLFIFPLILILQSFFLLPDALSSELSKYPQNLFRSPNLMEILMMLISSVSTLTILFIKPEMLRQSSSGLVLVSIVVWSLLITLNPFLNHQTGITGIVARLDALAYLKTAIAVPLLLSILFPYSKKTAFGIATLFLFSLVPRLSAPLPLGLRVEYLQVRERLNRELPAMRPYICEKSFIIAPHGEQFLVTAILRVPSQKKPPTENQNQCVYWLIHQPKTNYQIIFDKSVASSDGNFALVEYSEMKKRFEEITAEDRLSLISENRHLKVLSEQLTR